MTLHLYNTLKRHVEPFQPLNPDCPTMYLCGPTVYNYVHIGNARGPTVFGLLAALLRRRYGNLRYARNITDIDDKINAAAQKASTTIATITDQYVAAYRDDMSKLGVQPPDIEPIATRHIPQIIAMIQRLIECGHAYMAQQHVLFSITSFSHYGNLSNRSPEDMLAGARIDVAPYKQAPGDFVLWKPSSDTQPGWESPWGYGRPGWHIECSAMATTHLGKTIDIHAGGIDLQFPHHENEIAQSECAHNGTPFARWWLHNGMLNINGEKMSKSLENVETLHHLLQIHPPESLRYALLSAHYRQPLSWSNALIARSTRTLNRLYSILRDTADIQAAATIPNSIESALDDDLNTPLALAKLAGIANEARVAYRKHLGDRTSQQNLTTLHTLKAELLGAGLALGLLQQEVTAWFAHNDDDDHQNVRIQVLIDERVTAREKHDFARADAIREQLTAEGIMIEDTSKGIRWKRI